MSFLQKAGVVAIVTALVLITIAAFAVQFYSLSSPEAYIHVRQWEMTIGLCVGLPLLLGAVGLAVYVEMTKKR